MAPKFEFMFARFPDKLYENSSFTTLMEDDSLLCPQWQCSFRSSRAEQRATCPNEQTLDGEEEATKAPLAKTVGPSVAL
jgi:hypothetical protein